MANKARPTPEQITDWVPRLQEAAEKLRQQRNASLAAEDELREIVRGAFDAGIPGPWISEATGLSVSRLYQIKRGMRQ